MKKSSTIFLLTLVVVLIISVSAFALTAESAPDSYLEAEPIADAADYGYLNYPNGNYIGYPGSLTGFPPHETIIDLQDYQDSIFTMAYQVRIMPGAKNQLVTIIKDFLVRDRIIPSAIFLSPYSHQTVIIENAAILDSFIAERVTVEVVDILQFSANDDYPSCCNWSNPEWLPRNEAHHFNILGLCVIRESFMMHICNYCEAIWGVKFIKHEEPCPIHD